MAFLIDTHAHLDFPQFRGDLPAVLERARETGVLAVLNIGTDETGSRRSIALSRLHEGISASVGVHPHGAAKVTAKTWSELEVMATEPEVLAIGETGLDFYRDLSPRNIQEEVFRGHLQLATRVNKPVVVHSRDAHDQIIDVLRDESLPSPVGVMHCFSGTEKQLKAFLDLGFYISIAGPVTYPRSHALRDLLKIIPQDRLLIETDAPYLSPQAYRGRRNEPAYIKLTYERVALALGLDLPDLTGRVYQNALALFSDSLLK